MTNDTKTFAGLDTLRALAILLVFLFHYNMFQHPHWLEGFAHYGWTGVDLFFILSGFLISNQLFTEIQKNNRIHLKAFYIKRAFRILPPYLFILLIYIFVPAFHERERLPPLWKMFTFTQNFFQNIDVYGTFSHAWSLCVEEQFYFIFPLVLILIFSTRLQRGAAWLIPAFFLLPLLLRWLIWDLYLTPMKDTQEFGLNWYRWIYYPTITRIDGLMAGIALAAVYKFKNSWLIPFQRSANWISVAVFLLLLISYFTGTGKQTGISTIFGFSGIAIIYGFLTFSAISPGSFLFRFKSLITQEIAGLSYSIYLSHKGLIHLTQNLVSRTGVKTNGTVMFMSCIVVCLSGAYLMRVLIEKPAWRMRNKMLAKLY